MAYTTGFKPSRVIYLRLGAVDALKLIHNVWNSRGLFLIKMTISYTSHTEGPAESSQRPLISSIWKVDEFSGVAYANRGKVSCSICRKGK